MAPRTLRPVTPAKRPRALASVSRSALEREVRHERRVIRALSVVSMAMGASLSADELVDLVLAKLADAVEADRAMLYLLDAKAQHLRGRVLDEQGRLRTLEVPVDQGIAGAAVNRGESVVGDEEPPLRDEGVRTVGRGARSSIATPLTRHDGEVVGAVQLFRKRGKKPFDEDARAVLAALATQVAVALENAFLVDSLRKQAEELAEAKSALERQLADRENLLHLEHAMARATSTEALVRVVLEHALRSTNAEVAALALDRDHLGLGHDAHVGIAPEALQVDFQAAARMAHLRKVAVELGGAATEGRRLLDQHHLLAAFRGLQRRGDAADAPADDEYHAAGCGGNCHIESPGWDAEGIRPILAPAIWPREHAAANVFIRP